ncbi:MAG TPA: agmatinase [Firmicutes bacterium]|nr:agmatinase [Bacillota bacterium]
MDFALPPRENPGLFMAAQADLKMARGVILGVPLDDTGSFRTGSRFAPTAIRNVSHALEEYSLALDRTLEQLPFADAGDLLLTPGDFQGSCHTISRAVATLVGAGQKPFLLGGEHTLTLAAVEGCLQHRDSLAVLYLDAHADLRPAYMDLPLSHASVAYNLQRLPGVTLYQAGIRSAQREESARIRGGACSSLSLREAVQRIIPALKGQPLYISVDIDVVDPAFAPGVSAPEPGGVTSGELLQIFPMLAPLGGQVVAFDLVEICPSYDPAAITALLGAKIMREALLSFLK